MSVEFILGRSGTGKTSHCIGSVARALTDGDAEALILLLPEQATYQAERAILARSDIAGFSRLSVLSFNRLQFLLLGSLAAGTEISRLGREMAVMKILRENAAKLTVFGNAVGKPGLVSALVDIITELHQYAKEPEEVHKLTSRLKQANPQSLSALKFADIATVFTEYTKFIDDNKFINPDTQLTELLEKIPTAKSLKGAHIWVDGFASFTTQQERVLLEILKNASRSHIALCLDPTRIDLANPDPDALDPASLFSVTERTYCGLFSRIEDAGLTLAEPRILNKPLRFSNSKALAHIEANLFAAANAEPIPTDGTVELLTTTDMRAEAEFAAEKIQELVRQNTCRYRDIALIVPEIERYEHYINAIFEDYKIPYFIDKPRSLRHHPLVELLATSLHAATAGFNSSDCLAYLKTPLAPIEPQQATLLESYCLAFGIDRSDWYAKSDWAFAAETDTRFDEKQINRIRRKALKPLIKLKKSLLSDNKDDITAENFVNAVWDFLETIEARSKLCKWHAESQEEHSEHIQLYKQLIDIRDEMTKVFAAQSMPVGEFVNLLCGMLSKLTVKLIPQKLDQVLVGAIERSRHPDLKAVFVLGLTQKQFPSPIVFDKILTDDDRLTAGKHDFHLADTLAEKLAARHYLAYIAFTRPGEHLYITCPQVDSDGKRTTPSTVLNDLKSLFTDLQTQCFTAGDNWDNIYSHNQLKDVLCKNLSKDPTLRSDIDYLPLLAGLLCTDSDGDYRDTGQLVKNALAYDNHPTLTGDVTDPLFPGPLTFSASRLSTFASCPYKYFAQYTLALQERQLLTFEPVDVGSFYHEVLDRVSKQLIDQGEDFSIVPADRLRKICSQQAQAVLKSNTSIKNFTQRRIHNQYMIDSAIDTLDDCIGDIAAISRAGGANGFKLKASEVPFGPHTPSQCRIELADGRLVELNGKIDRIDIANIDGKTTALLFDYKKSDKTVSWQALYHGIDMQLPIYMLAAKEITFGDCRIESVAGAFYLPVESPITTTERSARKARGVFNGQYHQNLNEADHKGWDPYYNFYIGKDDPYGQFNKSAILKPNQFDALLEFTASKITELAEAILSGTIDISPYRINSGTACQWCPYRALCRFDMQFNNYSVVPKLTKQQLLDSIGASDD